MRDLHLRSGWAHFRATMAEPFTRRRSSFLGAPLQVEGEPGSGGGGGGGNGNGGGGGEGNNGGGDGGAGGAGGEDEAAKRAAQDKKLTEEAAAWRLKYRGAESRIKELEDAHNASKAALEAQIEELRSRGGSGKDTNPQGGAGAQPIESHPEFLKIQRTVKELSDNLRTERETLANERKALRTEKIQRAVSEVTGEGKFLMQGVFRKMLTDRVDIAKDGAVVLKVPNEVGGTDDVPFTLQNVLKYRPIEEFDSFLPSNGSAGSGSGGGNGNGGGNASDGVDWAKVNANDLDYIQKNMTKITAALGR